MKWIEVPIEYGKYLLEFHGVYWIPLSTILWVLCAALMVTLLLYRKLI